MSQPSDPTPQRIGDRERDQAAECLREHLAAGRLDQAEFDQRLSAALAARTAGEIEPLFSDLPAPKPGADLAVPETPVAVAVPENRSHDRLKFAMSVMTALLWPAAIIFCFATSWAYWWVILLPVFFSVGLKQISGESNDQHRRRLELESRQEAREDRREERRELRDERRDERWG